MVLVFRWLLRFFTGAVLLGLATFAGALWLAGRSLPEYNAEHPVSGISAPVEIVRDNANVPHIFGQSDEDVYFGLGFAHAQDRLWQMMILRRTAQGRLSEVFGERTVRIDEIMRRLDFYRLATQSVEAQDEYARAALTAYSAGVNAWLTRVNEEAMGRGAPEFFLFSNQIAPWQPADSIVMIKMMAMELMSQLEDEVLRARTSLMLSEERVADILPEAPGEGVAALPDYAALFPELPRYAEAAPRPEDPLWPANTHELAGASNVWAADPSRSAAGGTLLANDPHLGFSAPGFWYLARMELQTGGVIGGTIPGIPAVLVGRGEQMGWGLTSSYMDDQDIFIEKLNPDNPDEVMSPTGWEPLQIRNSIINVKDAAPVTITLQWSENGPIIPGDYFGLNTVTPRGHVASLAWTALSPRDTSMSSVLRLMRAQSVEDGIAAGELFIAPSQNLTLADATSIAMKTVGAMPRRSSNHQSQGRIPAPGWLAVNRWQGRMGYAANPEFTAPEGGIVGNTNNKMTDRPFPFHVSFNYGDTQRVQRWNRLMQSREVHTRESFIEAQLDTVSISARTLLPLVAADLWFTGAAAPEGTREHQRQRALELLADWNGEMNEHLPEPLIYSAWMRALQDRLIRDELGPLAREFTHLEPLFVERVFRDVDGASVWCDVIQSAATETCAEMARLALDDALLWIDENWGDALESLRWGDAHEAVHRHKVMGDIPGLGWLVNVRQSTSGGDNTLMRGKSVGTGPNPFLNIHGAGYRGVYDFADPDSSVFITATGQSGHFLSSHYDDLGELWRRGEYIPMSLDPELARAAAVGITLLEPR
ncbi:MAG: penicillin acylase family protein [Rhodobacteraceae bacterium]|nr:penicillin acylase family protein [Paracoccaceae bacterium]